MFEPKEAEAEGCMTQSNYHRSDSSGHDAQQKTGGACRVVE